MLKGAGKLYGDVHKRLLPFLEIYQLLQKLENSFGLVITTYKESNS